MLWYRIAATVAAVAAAAFEEAGIMPLCGNNGFPMHARRFDLLFNVARILWCILVIFHGRLGRFEAHIIEVPFLLAQFWTVIYHPQIIKNSFGNSPEFSRMVLVIFHGKLGRFEAHIIEVPFLLAQFWTVIYHPQIIKNCFGNSPEFSMMVLVLCDNVEFFLAILMVPIVSFHVHLDPS